MNYVLYSESVEQPQENEQKTFQDIADTMIRISTTMADRYRHGIRSVHAKSHGFFKGTLAVLPSLPEPLAQGLFAQPGQHDVVGRFSTNPGDILADSISTPRGLALKVMGVEGETFHGYPTQDFVMVNGKAFPNKNAAEFLTSQHLIEANANDPEGFKKLVSFAARGANAILGAVGLHSGQLEQLGAPSTHPLGETFFSAAPLRYGSYIAKVRLAPRSPNLKKLEGTGITSIGNYSALLEAISEWFAQETAIWEFGVQLCTDLEKMPVEDASVEWPEEESPYQPVALLTAPAQAVYSPERRVYCDEILSFSPWHALTAHRPLGNIMRARKLSYEVSSQFRHKHNVRPVQEPASAADIPD